MTLLEKKTHFPLFVKAEPSLTPRNKGTFIRGTESCSLRLEVFSLGGGGVDRGELN